MKNPLIPLAAVTMLISLTACHKPVAQEESSAPESSSSPSPAIAAATPAPAAPQKESSTAPTTTTTPAAAAPSVAELAPAGVFYLIEAARVETDSGVTGLPPGTGVKLLHDDVYLTPAGEAHLRREQVTNDMALARKALASEKAVQNAAQARIAADSVIIAERARAEAKATPQPAPQAAAVPTAIANPTSVPLGSSLSRPTDPLNTTHSSTKDKVYTDTLGRKYWKDTFGRIHYF